MGGDPRFWRRVAEVAGLTRADDLPFLLWPLLWAAWMATGGHPEPWCLAALLVAVLLARSAAWSAFLPDVAGLSEVLGQRRVLVSVFGFGALCFALPVGRSGWLVPLALALAAGWFVLRRRSYLSDPLLAAAVALPAGTAWLAQGGAPSKSAGLLLLAVALWAVSALIASPVQRGTASLAELIEPRHRALAGEACRLAALLALWLAGRQAAPGLYFTLGLGAALLLSGVRWRLAARYPALPFRGWEAVWGGLIFLGMALQLARGGGHNIL